MDFIHNYWLYLVVWNLQNLSYLKPGQNQLINFALCLLEVARFNHSCSSNSNAIWNEENKNKIIQAASEIKAGEEITINYDWQELIMKNLKSRQAYTISNWGFKCCCQLCQVWFIFILYIKHILISCKFNETVTILISKFQPFFCKYLLF